jgi:hypothetical protein
MELYNKVYFRSYFTNIKTSFTKLLTHVNIQDKIDSSKKITQYFMECMPTAITLAKDFAVTNKIVSEYYSELLLSTQLLPTIIMLFQEKINVLISFMEESRYIEPDMFFKDIYSLFNYWVKYLELIKNSNSELNKLYTDVNNYSISIRTVSFNINYKQKYLKYKQKYLEYKYTSTQL